MNTKFIIIIILMAFITMIGSIIGYISCIVYIHRSIYIHCISYKLSIGSAALILCSFLYLFQMWLAATINIFAKTRQPKNFIDFLKLTFLPYILYKSLTKPEDIR